MRNSLKISTFKLFLFLFVALLLALFLLRHTIFVVAAKIYLNTYLSKEGNVHYDTLTWEEDRLAISGFKLVREDVSIAVDRMEVKIENSFFPLYFEPHLLLIHPEIILQIDAMSSEPPPFGILFPTKYFVLKLQMQNGVLELDSAQKKDRLYFSYKSGEYKDKIGTFHLSYDPAPTTPALVSIEIQKKGEGLLIEGKIPRVECIKLQPLFSFIDPALQKGMQKIDGEMEGLLQMKISSLLAIEEVSLNVDVKELHFANSSLGIKTKAKSGSGVFLIPSFDNATPFWESLIVNASIRDGEFMLSDPVVAHPIGLKNVSCDLSLNPEEDPSFSLKATLNDETNAFPLVLEGRGGVNEDKTFWTEAELQIAKANFFLSFCCPKDSSYLIQAEVKGLEASHIHMVERAGLLPVLKEQNIQLLEGNFESLLSFWIDKGKAEKLQIDHFAAKDLFLKKDLRDCFFGSLKGSATLADKGEEFGLKFFEVDFARLNTKGFTGCEGHFGILDQKILPSYIAGDFFGRTAKVIFYTPEEMSWDLLGSIALIREEKDPIQIEFGCDVVFSPSRPEIGEGWFQVDNRYGVHVEHLKLDVEKEECDFAISVLDQGNEIAKTIGQGRKTEADNIHISLSSEQSHFFGVKPEQFELDFGSVNQLQLQIQDLQADVRFVLEKDRVFIPVLKLIHTVGVASGEAILFPDKMMAQADISHFKVDLSKVTDSFTGEGSGSAQLYVTLTEEKTWAAEGEVDLQLKLESPMDITFKSDTNIPISLHGTEFKFGDFSMLFSGGTLNCLSSASFHEIAYDCKSKEGRVDGAKISLSPEILERISTKYSLPSILTSMKKESLEMSFNCEFSKEQLGLKGNLKEGLYHLIGRDWDFSQISLHYDSEVLSLAAKTELNELDLFCYCKMDFTASPLGMIKLQESPKKEGVKILFLPSKEGATWESCKGSLYGLNVQLQKNSNALKKSEALVGTIKIDASELAGIFPNELKERVKKIKIGSGYELEGSLIFKSDADAPLEFVGKLKGKDFSLLGFAFNTLECDAEITPKKVILKNLSCDDEAGHLQIKQAKLMQTEDQWTFDIPLIQGKDIAPSLMHKVSGEKNNPKPLIVKNFTLSSLKGTLADAKTITGKGSLNFTNTYKKEFSILDLPFDMLKDLGLDFSLLTPVIGEIDFVVNNGQCVLTDFEAFSEERRSQFFLFDQETSYMDFEGNLHLDLKLKQDVTLKIAEPFTLNIRGNLEKPKYMLR